MNVFSDGASEWSLRCLDLVETDDGAVFEYDPSRSAVMVTHPGGWTQSMSLHGGEVARGSLSGGRLVLDGRLASTAAKWTPVAPRGFKRARR